MDFFRITLLLLFAFFTNSGFAQKTYSFDYLLVYEFQSYTDSLSNTELYYMTNSRDNSYYVEVKHIDSMSIELEFVVQDRLWTKQQLKKENFFKAESISLSCTGNLVYNNDFKFRIKDYQFENLPDTLVDDTKLKGYKLKYTGKRKRKKTFPVGSNLYIIEDSTKFHLPLLTHATEFEEWKAERNIPNGIFKEKIFYDYNDKMQYKYILKSVSQIKKKLIVPDKCLN